MRSIALVNQKGGCGKTTTAVNLASCFALAGRKVLLIDMDPQGHAGLGVGIRPERIEKSIYEVLLGKIKIDEAIRPCNEHLHVIPSDVVLSAFEQVMAGVAGREYQLKRSIDDLDDEYDYLVLDSPPGVGLLTFNVLMACNEVIVPVDSSIFSLHGLRKLLDTLALVESEEGRQFSIRILAANLDVRTRFSKTVLETLRTEFSGQCFHTVIHSGTRVREAAAGGKPIAEYAPACRSCDEYRRLSDEILAMEPAVKAVRLSKATQQSLEKSVVFALGAPSTADVRIAGDFNNWKPESLLLNSDIMEGAPRWRKDFSLKPGPYQYKYLLDGQWIADPENDNTVDDSFGGMNSLIFV